MAWVVVPLISARPNNGANPGMALKQRLDLHLWPGLVASEQGQQLYGGRAVGRSRIFDSGHGSRSRDARR